MFFRYIEAASPEEEGLITDASAFDDPHVRELILRERFDADSYKVHFETALPLHLNELLACINCCEPDEMFDMRMPVWRALVRDLLHEGGKMYCQRLVTAQLHPKIQKCKRTFKGTNADEVLAYMFSDPENEDFLAEDLHSDEAVISMEQAKIWETITDLICEGGMIVRDAAKWN